MSGRNLCAWMSFWPRGDARGVVVPVVAVKKVKSMLCAET